MIDRTRAIFRLLSHLCQIFAESINANNAQMYINFNVQYYLISDCSLCFRHCDIFVVPLILCGSGNLNCRPWFPWPATADWLVVPRHAGAALNSLVVEIHSAYFVLITSAPGAPTKPRTRMLKKHWNIYISTSPLKRIFLYLILIIIITTSSTGAG